MPRSDGRSADQIRPYLFMPDFARHATGSVLATCGHTQVICAAMIQEEVPRWMKSQNVSGGWITAEYSMLPYSTLDRKPRDITRESSTAGASRSSASSGGPCGRRSTSKSSVPAP